MKWISALDDFEVAYLEREVDRETRIIELQGQEYELEFIKSVLKIKNNDNEDEKSEPQ